MRPAARRLIRADRGNLFHATTAALLGLSVAACEQTPDPSAATETSLYALVQTIDGTYFAPPLGPEPAITGAFDPNLLASLSVVLESADSSGNLVATLATFDARTNPRLALLGNHELYFVNVPAAPYFTNPALTYRFRALLSGREIGRSDMSAHIFEVLRFIPTLPIGVKLRIEDRAAPTVASVAPASVQRAVDVAVTITGTGFVHDSEARLGAQTLATTWLSPTRLSATVPGDLIAAAGDYRVTVTTPAPGGGTSLAASLHVEPDGQSVAVLTAGGTVSTSPNYRLVGTLGGGLESAAVLRSTNYSASVGLAGGTR